MAVIVIGSVYLASRVAAVVVVMVVIVVCGRCFFFLTSLSLFLLGRIKKLV